MCRWCSFLLTYKSSSICVLWWLTYIWFTSTSSRWEVSRFSYAALRHYPTWLWIYPLGWLRFSAFTFTILYRAILALDWWSLTRLRDSYWSILLFFNFQAVIILQNAHLLIVVPQHTELLFDYILFLSLFHLKHFLSMCNLLSTHNFFRFDLLFDSAYIEWLVSLVD